MQSPPASTGPFQNTNTTAALPYTKYIFQDPSRLGRELNPKFGPIFSNSLMALITGLIDTKLLSCVSRECNIWLRPSMAGVLSTLNPWWKWVPFFSLELSINMSRAGWT